MPRTKRLPIRRHRIEVDLEDGGGGVQGQDLTKLTVQGQVPVRFPAPRVASDWAAMV